MNKAVLVSLALLATAGSSPGAADDSIHRYVTIGDDRYNTSFILPGILEKSSGEAGVSH